MKFDLSLYFLLGSENHNIDQMTYITRQAIAGGVTMIQLREKNIDTGKFIDHARKIREAIRDKKVKFIINDRVDVALVSCADGVHIGQSDMCPKDARRLLGNDKIIGLSVTNMHELEDANNQPIDYIGIGPVFKSYTKEADEITGLVNLGKIIEKSKFPAVAIGGIDITNARSVFETKPKGIAVVSAILGSADPFLAAKKLKEEINEKI